MPHSVVITTPIPTWEETVQAYRLSKAERRFVEGLFEDKTSKRRAGVAAKASRSAGARKNGADVSEPAGKSAGRKRKSA